MLNLFSRKTKPTSDPIRDLLFADPPLESWSGDSNLEPWASFTAARVSLNCGDTGSAILTFRRIIETPDLESRHYVKAWNELRRLGVSPPDEEAKRVLGVVAEVPMESKFDVLACYEDNTARYIHHVRGLIAIVSPVPLVTPRIQRVLAVSRAVVPHIGPHTTNLLPPPPPGNMRISFLTPSGLHFGQGPRANFERDPVAGPVFVAATELLLAVIEAAKS